MAGSRILFHPLVEDTALLLGLMASSMGLVFPSLVEAMSMVLLEAASVEAPVICSDIPENREVMREDALYFSSGNIEDLARQLEYALSHRPQMAQMGQRARSRVLVEYDWDAIAARYEALYRACVKER